MDLCGVWNPLEEDKKVLVPKGDLISPFFLSEKGYRWPDLYSEIDEMIETTTLIYPLAELRRMARDGKVLFGREKILATPLTHEDVVQVVEANRKELESMDAQILRDFYFDVLKTLEERSMMHVADDKEKALSLSPSTIVAFDDEFEMEELVYMVDVNHKRKRVTVCFRGSVTKKDWATDYEIFMKEVDNPMKHHASQEPTVRVHNGFYDYLFTPSSRGVKGPNGEELSEYQEILQEHLLPVLRENPGYKLYVTGHSLGAALATLFAFEVASAPDSDIPKPVSLFSIAGPYVGDISFRDAHQQLEAHGKLRHARVTNHKDLITIVPKFSFKWNIFDQKSHVGSLFKHVGLNIKFYEGSAPFEISYPRVRTGYISGTIEEVWRGWDQALWNHFSWNPMAYWKWPFHSVREYSKRLDANKPSMEAIYLNDLYSREDIVGYLVPQF